jgi:hypothetical protein
LFCIDYRKKYFNANNNEVKQKFKKDILKLLTTLGISEIGYLSSKFLSIYYIFATINIDSSQISILSTIIAWTIYIIIANLLIKKYQIL